MLIPGSYATTSPLLLGLLFGALAALVVALVTSAWAAARAGASARLPLALAAVAAAWLSSGVPGVMGLALVVVHAAMLAFSLLPVALAGVAVGLLPHGRGRRAVEVLATATATAIAARVLVIEPFEDPRCWSYCAPRGWDVDLGGSGEAVVDLLAGGLAVALVAIVGLTALGMRGARLEASRVAVAVAGALWAAFEVAGRTTPHGDPFAGLGVPAFGALAVGLASMGTILALGAGRQVARARALDDIVAVLEDLRDPERFRTRLARALGGPAALRFPTDQGWVDLEGRAVDSDGGKGPANLGLGAAARMALDIGRLNAQAAANLRELRESRSRIVDEGDATRRRIERDLHDGAQQRLIAASYELRAHPDAAEVAECLAAVLAVVARLRDVANRVFPAILADRGLGAALTTLAESAPVPVTVREVPERLSAGAELALYHVALDALRRSAAAGSAGDAGLAIAVERSGSVATMEVSGPAVGALAVHLEDRVGAVGGLLTVRDGYVRAEVPCG